MRLNPSKCAFGVSSGKFLGFMVSHRGIEANLDKIQAILNMEPSRISKKSSLLLDELLPLIGLILKLLINVCHFLRYLKRHLSGRMSIKKPSRT